MRKALTFGFGVFWMVALFVPMFPVLFLWPTRTWRQRISRVYSRWWSKGCLWVAGIRVVIEGREHLRTCPAVFTFNHTSMVDFFVNATLAPAGCMVFGKKELVRVPFMGWMWFFGGHPMIERKNRDQWALVLDYVEQSLESGKHSTMIAPEGTRSRDGKLLPFKKGPFVIAMKSGAPIVPLVLKGMMDVFVKGVARPGTVTVTVLPPISSEGWEVGNLDENIELVRAAYKQELGEGELSDVPEGDPSPSAT